MTRSWIRWVSSLFVLVVAVPCLGQETEGVEEPVQHHPEGDAAISQLKSPFCPGLMLEVCSHPDSKVLRDTIQVMAQSGVPADSLVSWMLATYGEQYRAVPEARGSGLFAWLMPPFALVAGLLIVVVALRHYRSRRGAPVPQPRALSPEEETVLAAALEEMKAAEEVPF